MQYKHYEEILEKLNEYQKEAVLDESEACIVNANVGSGKTTVLISKVLYLHYAKGVSYKDMIVLTFTNKAANEIKERLTNADSSIQMEELQGFGTFHSVALNLLKNKLPVEKLGYTKEFMVIDPEEEIDIALQLIQQEKLVIKYKNRLKKRLEQAMAEALEEQKVSSIKDDILALAKLLKEEKVTQNKMTFQDLLDNAIVLLKDAKQDSKLHSFEVNIPNVEPSLKHNLEHSLQHNEEVNLGTSLKLNLEPNLNPSWIIIDEVQDSDKLQLDFIDKLKGSSTRIFAVGDPNQVIYSWRGSSSHAVYTLKHRYHAKEMSLPINYRSSSNILEAAKRFLENGESLVGIRDSGNKIIVKNHYNPFNEACYLADKVLELHSSGVAYKDIAVFYRTQNQSQVLEDVFTKEEIPYEVSLKKTVGDIPVVNWMIKLLRFSVNSADFTSGVFVLSHKDYGERVSEKEAGKILREQKASKSMLFTKMKEFTSINKFKNINEFNKINEFAKTNEFTVSCSETTSTKALYDYFEIDNYIHPTASTYEEDNASICALLDIILEHVKEKGIGFLEGLKDFINSSALYGVNILQKDTSSHKDSVKLMTLHASKGLEFSHVFITGVNYGLIPLQTRNEEEEEEERRLFFVGITRAKDYLELSYYTNPDFYKATAGESRFIRMLPPHLIQNDSEEKEAVNLQELKKQIQKSIAEKIASTKAEAIDKVTPLEQPLIGEEKLEEEVPVLEESAADSENPIAIKKVSHKKYGIGQVLMEDDMMIEIEFENYGIKEFMKAFSELEYL